MKVDVSKSIYHEAMTAKDDFNPHELKSLRLLLRRLRFLEQKVRTEGGINSGSEQGAFAEWEVEALELVLTEVGYLAEPSKQLEGAAS